MNKKLIVAMIAAAWGHAALLAEGDGTPSLPCGREVVSRVNGGLRLNQTPAFTAARSVWPQGRETRMNDFVEFRASFDAKDGDAPVLRVTGCSVYRIRLNGEFTYGWWKTGCGRKETFRAPRGWSMRRSDCNED